MTVIKVLDKSDDLWRDEQLVVTIMTATTKTTNINILDMIILSIMIIVLMTVMTGEMMRAKNGNTQAELKQ